MKIFLKVLNNLDRKEKKKASFVFFLMFIMIILDFFSIGLFFPLISSIFNPEFYEKVTVYPFFESWERIEIIYFFLTLIFITFLLKNILFLIFNFNKKKFLASVQYNFSSRIFKSYISQHYSIFLKKDKSELMRNTSLVNEYTYIIENFITLTIESIILLFIGILIFKTNFYFGIIILFFLIITFFIISKLLFNRLNWYGKNINIQAQKLLDNYINIFGSVKEIILSKKQNFFNEKFKKNLSINLNNEVKSGFIIDLPRAIIELFLVFFIGLSIFINFEFSKDYNDFLTKIVFLGALIFRAMPSFSKIIYQAGSVSFKFNKLKLVNKLIEDTKENAILDNIVEKKRLNFSKLELKNISFEYIENKKILENINLIINKNDTIGIFSRSGSGKSTLLDVITGLIKPIKGEIIINDELNFDNKNINLFQNCIGYISQNNFLINDSIKNNITFGLEENEINYKKLNQVLKISKLNNLVESKSEGINYYIGDNGKNISGGQRQRIVIARSLYKDLDILILDEPTSSLDEMNEKEIINDIKDQFYKKKTIIICSHNWELLNFCDKIYKVENRNLTQIIK